MPVTRDQWKQLYAVFDPAQRLEISDADLFVERPGAVAAKIARSLQLEASGKWIVCGSMGSGKSSELAHLGGLLQNQFAVVGLDLPNTVASVDRLQAAEVLFLIGVAAIRAASELWDHTISEQASKRLVDALRPLLVPNNFELQPSEILQGIDLLVDSSGGVLRNLILVTRYAIESAFHDDRPQISRELAEEAVTTSTSSPISSASARVSHDRSTKSPAPTCTNKKQAAARGAPPAFSVMSRSSCYFSFLT